ncbi:TolC family protein [Pontibacter sp. G13]|uniref:TolC family protein n=1 Tax=Pontibacter sp. G13 TaxID=3074898 RepID=UPI002889E29E|nr:TolC family protein [Pontibacter sp. G13]WNJ20291.1 TolC family protein [Pontibacter sp. G13]
MKHTLFALLAMLTLWSSCKFHPAYEGIPMENPISFRMDSVATDTIVNLRWWEAFNDPYLDTLVAVALRNNRDVRIAANRIEQSEKFYKITKADFWPSFNGSIDLQRGNLIGGIPGQGENNLLTGFLNGSWELDFWGKFRSANEAARADLIASEYGHRVIQISLISQVAQTYFQMLEFQARIDISEQTLALRDSMLGIILERYEAGIIAEIDVNQAQIQRAIAASSVPLYQRQLVLTENALSVLIGDNPQKFTPVVTLVNQEMPDEIPPGLPSSLLTRRPDILQAEQFVIAQNATIGIANANRFPAISLTGAFGLATLDLSNLGGGFPGWSIGASLLQPIFNFGQLKRQVEVEKLKLEESILNYEAVVLNAFREVEDALVSIRTLKEEIEYRRDHVEAAQNALMLSQLRYDKGVTSYLEYLESQRQAFEAQQNYAGTRAELLSAYVSLYNALGGGWISPEEEAAAEAAEQEEAEEDR